MPKISKHGGPTVAGVTPAKPDEPTVRVVVDAGLDEVLRARVRELVNAQDDSTAEAPLEQEVTPSVGSSSSASTQTPQSSGARKSTGRRKPAPTTENPSATDQTELSSAPSTDGLTPPTGSDPTS